MTQLPYPPNLGAPNVAPSYSMRSPSPGLGRRQSMPPQSQEVGAAHAPGSSFPLGAASLGRSATVAPSYTTNAMSSRIAQQPTPAGFPLPSQQSGASLPRPSLPQPAPHQHSQIYANHQSYPYSQSEQNSSITTTPLRQQPCPAPSDPRAAHVAALAAHHASLVAYYWHYAQQGLAAPVEFGNDMQLRAREEAVSWARGQGIVVVDPNPPVAVSATVPQPPATARPTPALPPQRQSTAPAAVSYPQPTPQPSQAATPLPFAPSPSSTVNTVVPPSGNPLHLHTSTSTAPATPSVGRPLPSPIPTPSTGRPLPSVPAGSGTERRPLPSPISTSTSGLLRSASLANSPSSPVSPDSPSSLHRAASTSVVPSSWAPAPPSPASVVSTASSSLVGVGPSFLDGKRPLPTPPGGATRAARPLPGIVKTPEVLIQEQLASMTVQDVSAPPPRAPSPKPAPPAVPSMSFSGPDDEESAPRPPSPSFTFTLADEDDTSSTAPAVPSFSTSAPTPSFSLAHSHPLPTSPTTYDLPRVHPRFDPNHPSHYLYHPTSTAPSPSSDSPVPTGLRLEAGAIACAGCGQQMFGRALMAMGREWHPDCFRCAEQGCGLLLEHVQFDGREGEGVYCMVHFEEHYAEKCFHCKTPIADSEYINISDPLLLPPTPIRTYHATHFFCSNCGDPFVDPSSLAKGKEHTLAKPYLVHKGYAYCEGCDLRMYKPKCVRCKKGIAADWIEAGEAKYHMECFKCVDCDKILSGHYLMRDDGPEHGGEQTFCGECYDHRAKNE